MGRRGGDARCRWTRLTLCNLSIDFGAKAGLIEPDEVTRARSNGDRSSTCIRPDHARYLAVHEVDAHRSGPQVAVHPAIDNVHDIDDVAGTPLDEVFIGSCTNGRLEDLAIVAQALEGREVHPRTRT